MRLTAARLSHPEVDTLYAARVQHIPFQFKPLLRLLRADQPRLLIADEVGVGKTIAAGLILKELQTRQRLDSVLIVCPKALVPKWRAEMRRFDEDFRPLAVNELRYCLDEAHLDGTWPAQDRPSSQPGTTTGLGAVPYEMQRLKRGARRGAGERWITGSGAAARFVGTVYSLPRSAP